MKTSKAIDIAIQAIKMQTKKIAVDANLHEQFNADYPAAINAFKKRKEYREAILALEEIKQGKRFA